MTPTSESIRLLARPAAVGAPPGEPRGPGSGDTQRGVLPMLSALDELAVSKDSDSLLKSAVEIARRRIGLERVSFFMRDSSPERVLLRGSWGTGLSGETTDERTVCHELGDGDLKVLRELRGGGALWVQYDQVPLYSEERDKSIVVGRGWLAVTPLILAHDVVGVMYNDAALSGAPPDEEKQALAAMFASVVASVFVVHRGVLARRASRQQAQSPLVRQVVAALAGDPLVSGQHLARRLGISPGHLARSFKREMGVSLVDYRNRLRIQRFFQLLQRGEYRLLDAALEAGFGSYAQFHRVYRKLVGSAPRHYLSTRRGGISAEDRALFTAGLAVAGDGEAEPS
jgi:AraC-like DNA-binding protein